jgi:hypothetical protein
LCVFHIDRERERAIHVFTCIYVCVCICICTEREREKAGKKGELNGEIGRDRGGGEEIEGKGETVRKGSIVGRVGRRKH